jgi:pimeloyl-ACP methyl ester carboxylesterase
LNDAFSTIEKEVTNFRNQGKTKIVLVGHSMGTAGALAYTKHRGGIDGVIGVAPGHFPGSDNSSQKGYV